MQLSTLMQRGIDPALIQNDNYKSSLLEKTADFFLTPARELWVSKRLTLIEKKGESVKILEETRGAVTQEFGKMLEAGLKVYPIGPIIVLILIAGAISSVPLALLSAGIGLGLKKIAIETNKTSKSYSVAMDYRFKINDLKNQADEIERKKQKTLALKTQHSEIDPSHQEIENERIKNQIEQIDISLTKKTDSIEGLQKAYEESLIELGKNLAS